jgi:glycosyltransferase involved in cell wall biosynthesis
VDKGKYMKLSILISSFQRGHLLKYNLQQLAKQYKPFSYEILVLNDGIIDDTEEICNQFKKDLNIRYIFTGQRNIPNVVWRIPGFTVNIGIKQALGEHVIISCAEMFLLDDVLCDYVRILDADRKSLVITEGKDDIDAVFLENLKHANPTKFVLEKIYNAISCALHTEYPFFMGINRQELLDIGGYDEDLIGYCWDDYDLIERLKDYGNKIVKIPKRVLHLYHARLRYGMVETTKKWKYNEKLCLERKDIIKRNQDREWGVL